MIVANTNVRHIRFNDEEDFMFEVLCKKIEEVRTTMRALDCDLMYNTQTGECVLLDELDRMCGILSGLGDMDEILKEV